MYANTWGTYKTSILCWIALCAIVFTILASITSWRTVLTNLISWIIIIFVCANTSIYIKNTISRYKICALSAIRWWWSRTSEATKVACFACSITCIIKSILAITRVWKWVVYSIWSEHTGQASSWLIWAWITILITFLN